MLLVDIRGQEGHGGIPRYTQQVVAALSKHMSMVLWWNSKKKKVPHWAKLLGEKKGVHVVDTRMPNWLLLLLSCTGLLKHAGYVLPKHIQKKITLWWTPHHQPLPTGSTPHVITVHDVSFVEHTAWYTFSFHIQNALCRFAFRCKGAAAIITPSRATKKAVEKVWHIPAKRIHPIALGVSESFMKKISAAEKKAVRKKYRLTAPFILCVGSLTARKNTDMLWRAFLAAKEKVGKKAQLVLAGNISPAGCQRYAKKARIIKNTTDAELAALMAESALVCQPSVYEGFYLPPFEALSVGAPVAVSDIAVTREYLKEWLPLIQPESQHHWQLKIEEALTKGMQTTKGQQEASPRL